MGAEMQWGKVIHSNGQAIGLTSLLHFCYNWGYNAGIKIGDGSHLFCKQTLVPALIRGLHMDGNKIFFFKNCQGCLGLAGLVGVKVTGCSLHFNHLTATQYTNTF